MVFLLCSHTVYSHAVRIHLPVTGHGGGFPPAAMDKIALCAGGAPAGARSDKRSAYAGVFVPVGRDVRLGLSICMRLLFCDGLGYPVRGGFHNYDAQKMPNSAQ